MIKRRGNIEVICIECGKKVYVKPSEAAARKFCSHSCRTRWRNKNVPKKHKFNIAKELLTKLYCIDELSQSKIAEIYSVDPKTVSYWMQKYDIPKRSIKDVANLRIKKPELSKAEIEDLYLRKGLSMQDISNECGITRNRVSKLLTFYAIPKKDRIQMSMSKLGVRPNIPERTVLGVIEKHSLPYRYTGDGDVIIGGKCPDFFNTNGNKIVIEVFGRAFHSPLFTFKKKMPYHQTYKGTIEHYKKYGLKCIVLWDRDIMREDGEDFVLNAIQKMGGM